MDQKFALAERIKAKDAYDIAFVLRNYDPDVETLGDQIGPMLARGLAREAYEILKEKFASLNSVGPTWAANVAQEQGSDFEQSQRSAFEDTQALFVYVAHRK